jgi:hypothetical protein
MSNLRSTAVLLFSPLFTHQLKLLPPENGWQIAPSNNNDLFPDTIVVLPNRLTRNHKGRRMPIFTKVVYALQSVLFKTADELAKNTAYQARPETDRLQVHLQPSIRQNEQP